MIETTQDALISELLESLQMLLRITNVFKEVAEALAAGADKVTIGNSDELREELDKAIQVIEKATEYMKDKS